MRNNRILSGRQWLGSMTITLLAASLQLAATSAFADNLSYADPEDVGMSSARIERIMPVLQSYVDEGELAGVVRWYIWITTEP